MITGGASVSYHMLNEESRKYFNRAIIMSGVSFNNFALYESNHLERMQNFTNIKDEQKLVEYLKAADSAVLAKVTGLKDSRYIVQTSWAPTIESPETNGAFITQHPEEIYQSDKAPIMDAIFTFNSMVLKFNEDYRFYLLQCATQNTISFFSP